MNKKKILIVANGLSNVGGIGNALHNMIREMYRLSTDFELDLLLFDYESRTCISDLPCNIISAHYKYNLNISTIKMIGQIIKLKMPAIFLYHRLLFRLHFTLPLMRDMANSIFPLDNEYDLAIAYNCIPSYITSYVASFVKAKRKIAWAHIDIDQKYANHYGKKTILRVNRLHNYKDTMKAFDCIYAVSEKVKESLLRYFSKELKVTVFLNFVNKDLIISKSKEPLVIEKTKDNIVLLTVARLSFEKGIKLSLSAANILRKRGCSFKWFFIGALDEPSYIKKYIERHHLGMYLELMGTINNPYPFFRACDIYVHTSYVEGYCTAINEARILSKPIVSTDVSGVREQINNGTNGIIVNNSSIQIANAIQLLIDNGVMRKQIEANNRSLVINNNESSRKLHFLIDE